MTVAPQGPTAATHPFVSDGLGLATYPVGTEEPGPLGEHVMGAVVLAWMGRHALDAWGEGWATGGAIDARFRAHLTSGLPLTMAVARDGDAIDLAVVDDAGTTYATATATRGGSDVVPPRRPAETARAAAKLPLSPEALHGRALVPLTFEFDAGRDLAFTATLADHELWSARGWAHPAWLASATNAMLRRSLDFAPPGVWTNAGIRHRSLAAIRDGSTITLTGHIADTFQRSRHRFAVAEIAAWVGDQAAALVRNTFVYDTRPGP